VNSTGTEKITSGNLYLVDLAGSENIKRSGAESTRAREAGKINQSLLTLNRCIKLKSQESKSQTKHHIPYRESKLTQLLQPVIGGKSRTTMIINISPCETDYEETMSTLEYGREATNIKNKPLRRVIENSAQTFENQNKQIQDLRAQLERQNQKSGGVFVETSQWEIEQRKLRAYDQVIDEKSQLESECSELKNTNKELKEENGTLQEEKDVLKSELELETRILGKSLDHSQSQCSQADQFVSAGKESVKKILLSQKLLTDVKQTDVENKELEEELKNCLEEKITNAKKKCKEILNGADDLDKISYCQSKDLEEHKKSTQANLDKYSQTLSKATDKITENAEITNQTTKEFNKELETRTKQNSQEVVSLIKNLSKWSCEAWETGKTKHNESIEELTKSKESFALVTDNLCHSAAEIIMKFESSRNELSNNLQNSKSEFQKQVDSMFLKFSVEIDLMTKREDEREDIKINFDKTFQEEHTKLNETKSELINSFISEQTCLRNELEKKLDDKREEMTKLRKSIKNAEESRKNIFEQSETLTRDQDKIASDNENLLSEIKQLQKQIQLKQDQIEQNMHKSVEIAKESNTLKKKSENLSAEILENVDILDKKSIEIKKLRSEITGKIQEVQNEFKENFDQKLVASLTQLQSLRKKFLNTLKEKSDHVKLHCSQIIEAKKTECQTNIETMNLLVSDTNNSTLNMQTNLKTGVKQVVDGAQLQKTTNLKTMENIESELEDKLKIRKENSKQVLELESKTNEINDKFRTISDQYNSENTLTINALHNDRIELIKSLTVVATEFLADNNKQIDEHEKRFQDSCNLIASANENNRTLSQNITETSENLLTTTNSLLAKRKPLCSEKIDNFLGSPPSNAFETDIIQPGLRANFVTSINAEDAKKNLERTRIQQLKDEAKENEAPSLGSDSEYLASDFNAGEKMLKQREKRPRQALQAKSLASNTPKRQRRVLRSTED